MKKTTLILLFHLCLLACTPESDKKKDAQTTEQPQKPKFLWEYSETADEMTNEKSRFAQLNSDNKAEFKFPYQGGSTFALILRRLENTKSENVFLGVSKGQFIPNFGQNEVLRVKFDNEDAFELVYTNVENKSNIIMLDRSGKFAQRLKTAKKLLIEAPFFNEDRFIIRFNVEGLEW